MMEESILVIKRLALEADEDFTRPLWSRTGGPLGPLVPTGFGPLRSKPAGQNAQAIWLPFTGLTVRTLLFDYQPILRCTGCRPWASKTCSFQTGLARTGQSQYSWLNSLAI